ncbi:MAG: VWA domain-containing protein [Gammaproteobacteria bacterium]|nr:VWA domain-containing protein [Gammaproteobacteria bacterium]
MMTLIRKICLLLLLNLLPSLLQAQTDGIDAVLVLDSSGSMQDTDPDRLRVPAAKLFLSLLGKDDRAGVISFSDEAYPVVHVRQAYGQYNQDILFEGVDKISAKGAYTNLHAALVSGRKMLLNASEKGRRRILILMSDGRMDVGDADKDRRYTRDIMNNLASGLKQDGVEVFSIAFTRQADAKLMRAIAEKSGGVFHSAAGVDDLHDVFGSIFENVKQPDMLPMEGGRFVVDAAVEEVTIVASRRRPEHSVVLELPNGKKLTANNIGRMGRWSESPRFDMITIQKPMAGDWKILSSSINDKAYVVTNLGLEANLKKNEIPLGAEMDLSAWMLKDGKVITVDALLQGTEFIAEVISPTGDSNRIKLWDSVDRSDSPDGRYQGQLLLDHEGRHKIKVVAKAATFQREKTFYLNVLAPSKDKTAVEPVAKIKPKAEPKPEPKPKAEPKAKVEEPVADKVEKKAIDIGLIVMIFVGANVVVGIFIGGFLWWRSRKNKKQAEDDKNKDEDEDEDDELG